MLGTRASPAKALLMRSFSAHTPETTGSLRSLTGYKAVEGLNNIRYVAIMLSVPYIQKTMDIRGEVC